MIEFVKKRIEFLKSQRGVDTSLMVGEYEALLRYLTDREVRAAVPVQVEKVRMVEDGRLGPHVERIRLGFD